ncbi:hypothetical protein C0J52_08420 [Blattella germanica]|nr:hypothetical protein C0J52_08420 [Blattella germanica]
MGRAIMSVTSKGPLFLRVSVPEGMDAALEGLTREVLKQQPRDIYWFAAEHFESLIHDCHDNMIFLLTKIPISFSMDIHIFTQYPVGCIPRAFLAGLPPREAALCIRYAESILESTRATTD